MVLLYFSVTSQNLDNGAVAVNFSVGGGTNDQFDIQIINGTSTLAGYHFSPCKCYLRFDCSALIFQYGEHNSMYNSKYNTIQNESKFLVNKVYPRTLQHYLNWHQHLYSSFK